MQPKLDGILRDMLRSERRRITNGEFDSYYVCHDVSIDEMATFKPSTIDALKKIKGIKTGKASQYGARFLAVIAKRPDITFERIYTLDELMARRNSEALAEMIKRMK